MEKYVLITGASSGIGAATSKFFAAQGWQVALLGRNIQRLEQTKSECQGRASIFSCDLSSGEAVEVTIKTILKWSSGKLHALINNAGIYEPGPAVSPNASKNLQGWRHQFEVNLFSAVYVTELLLPALAASAPSAVVNVSSTLGLRPIANTTAYSASKAAMVNWTQGLALELGSQRVRVNAVCPGLVDTPIHPFHCLKKEEKDQAIEKLKSLQPLGRIGQAQEIAQAIYFLASENSSWTTGSVLVVDGGINLT